MRNTICIILCWAVMYPLYSQQEANFTQLSLSQVLVNPAYCSHINYAEIDLLFRDQWNGVDGAPTSQNISASIPFLDKNFGIGFSFNRNTIGIEQSYNLRTMAAYQLYFDRSRLSFGLELSGRQYRRNYTDDRLVGFEGVSSDPSVAPQQAYTINCGAGLLFSNKRLMFGLSAPRLLNPRTSSGSTPASEVLHVYSYLRTSHRISEHIELRPQVFFRYVDNSPFDIDLQILGIYKQEYHAGINYRLGGELQSFGESLGLVIGMRPFKRFLLSLAYDITLSPLRQFDSGSIEMLMRYSFGDNDPTDKIKNPRYF